MPLYKNESGDLLDDEICKVDVVGGAVKNVEILQ